MSSVLLADPAASLGAREGDSSASHALSDTHTLTHTLAHTQPETETATVTVTDPRATLSPDRVNYKQVHALRVRQLREGFDTRSLTDTQWGLVPLDKCHHVSTTSSSTASAAPSPAHTYTHSLTQTRTHSHAQSENASPSAHTSPAAETNTASSPVSGPHTQTGTHTDTHKGTLTQQTSTEREGEPPMHTPISSPTVTRVPQSLSPGVLSPHTGGTSTTTSYRVRICKTCCGEANHVELGTYLDQESALLVNDVHELLHARTQRLHLLCAQDLPLGREGERELLRSLRARKHDRLSRACASACREGQPILDILADRLPPVHSTHTHSHTDNNNENNNENNNNAHTHAYTASPETSRKRKTTSVSAYGTHTLSENARRLRSPIGQSNGSQHTADTTENGSSAELSPDRNNNVGAVRFHPDTTQHSHTTHAQAFKRQRSFTFSTAADFAPQSFFAPSAPLSAASVERGGALAWLAEIASEEADCVQTLYALRQASTPSELLLSPRFSSHNTQTPAVTDTRTFTHSNGAEECVSTAEAKEEDDKDEEEEEEEEGVSAQLLAMADYFSPDATERKHIDPYQTNWLSFCGASGSNGSFVASSAVDPLSLLTSSALALSAQTQPHMHTRSLTQSLLHTAETSSTQQETRTQLSSSSASVRTHAHTSAHELPAARRGRSNSMSVIESSLGSFGSSRAKDPLSIALRKYIERGGPGDGFIGIYSPEDRRARLQRFQEKRKHRLWTKKVKYDVRKNFADSRIRIKGRFVKKDEEQAVLSLVMRSTGSGTGSGNAHNAHMHTDGNGAGLREEGDEEDEEEGEGEEDEDRGTVSSSSSSSKRRSQASSKSATQAVTQSSARRSRASSLGSATTSVRKKRSTSFSSSSASARKGSAKQQ